MTEIGSQLKPVEKESDDRELTLLMSSTKRATKFGTREDMVNFLSVTSLPTIEGNDEPSMEDATEILASPKARLKQRRAPIVSSFESIEISDGTSKPPSSPTPTLPSESEMKSKTKRKRKKRKKRQQRPTNQNMQEVDSEDTTQPLNNLLAHKPDSISKKREPIGSLEDRMGIRDAIEVPETEEDVEKSPLPPRTMPVLGMHQFMMENSARTIFPASARDPMPSVATFAPPNTGRESADTTAFETPVFVEQEPLQQVHIGKKGRIRITNRGDNTKGSGTLPRIKLPKEPYKAVINTVRKIVRKNL